MHYLAPTHSLADRIPCGFKSYQFHTRFLCYHLLWVACVCVQILPTRRLPKALPSAQVPKWREACASGACGDIASYRQTHREIHTLSFIGESTTPSSHMYHQQDESSCVYLMYTRVSSFFNGDGHRPYGHYLQHFLSMSPFLEVI